MALEQFNLDDVPDINVSVSDFTARGDTIPFGLSAIRNVGEGLVQLIAVRDEGGPFTDFYDFCQRVDPQVLNKRAIESLVKAGAFDSLGHPRKGLCLVFEQIIDKVMARRREADAGVLSLFGDVGGDDAAAGFDDSRVPIPVEEWDKMQRLSFEKDMLGLYISDHPLMGAETRSPATPTARSPSCGTRRRATSHRRRHRHRAPAQVHQAGRAHGRVHAGGPPVVHRGHGLPPDDGRARPQARGRRGHRREGPPRCPRRAAEAGRDGHLAPPARARRGRADDRRPQPGHPYRGHGRSGQAAPAGASRAVPGVPPDRRQAASAAAAVHCNTGNGLVAELRVLLGEANFSSEAFLAGAQGAGDSPSSSTGPTGDEAPARVPSAEMGWDEAPASGQTGYVRNLRN